MTAGQMVRRVGITLMISGVLILIGTVIIDKIFHGLAFLIALLWCLVNLYLLSHILRGFVEGAGKKKGIAIVLLFVKFPVLYGGGYFILRTGMFPLTAVALGITFFLITIGVVIFHYRDEFKTIA